MTTTLATRPLLTRDDVDLLDSLDETHICERGDHVIDEIGDDCAECLAYDD